MAAKSNLVNMTVCLTAVCLVCAALLGVVYAMTYQPIQDASLKALNASISLVLPASEQEVSISEAQTAELGGKSYEYFCQLSSEGSVTAYAVKSVTIGFGGPLTVMVGVLPDGTVVATRVLSHSETPGLGAKCETDGHFLGQFEGLAPDVPVKLAKDGGSLDAITASTITSRAYTLAVSNAVELVKSLGGSEDE